MRALVTVFTVGIVAAAPGAPRAEATPWTPPSESYALMVFDLGALAGENDVIPDPTNGLVLHWPDGCTDSDSPGGPLCAAT